MRAAYVDKISGKIGDLFRGYWTLMDRLEVCEPRELVDWKVRLAAGGKRPDGSVTICARRIVNYCLYGYRN